MSFFSEKKHFLNATFLCRTFCHNTPSINGIRQITSDDLSSFQLELSGGILANVVLNSQMVGFNQVRNLSRTPFEIDLCIWLF